MEAILAIVKGPSTSEITSFDQIDHSVFQELLQKSFVWDFYEISKEEYMNEDGGEKKILILKYYNYMLRDKLLLFVSIVSLSEFCVSDIKLVWVVSVFSLMTSFSPVCFIVQYISSSEEKFQIKIWLEILILTFLAMEKLIQITSFHGLMILIRKEKINFNWGINF